MLMVWFSGSQDFTARDVRSGGSLIIISDLVFEMEKLGAQRVIRDSFSYPINFLAGRKD